MSVPPHDEDETVDVALTRTLTLEDEVGLVGPARYAALGLPHRYQDLGYLASGAMGEVRKVRDQHLGAIVAMKLLRVDARALGAVQARFEAEAKVTARLRHPNIVAIHDSGLLEDGRLWFTMELVEGETLDGPVSRVHGVRGANQWRPTRDGWTLRGLAEAYNKICEAMALAHARGVTHRDLKPHNIMVGSHGMVKVMDWGIACGPDFDLAAERAAVEAFPSEHRTAVGRVLGTPAYMAPEQARGERDRLGPRSDVYALGAVLYFILTGCHPYEGTPSLVVERVKQSPPRPILTALGSPAPPLPPGLLAICERAMQRDPSARYADASELADAVRTWLIDEERRQHAQSLVDRVRELEPELHRRKISVEALRQSARTQLAAVPTYASVQVKTVGWQLYEYADENLQAMRDLRVELEESLWAALTVAPNHVEARRLLAKLQYDALVDADKRHDEDEAEERMLMLSALDDGTYAPVIEGQGWVSLRTEPSGAEVELYGFQERDRRLEPVFLRTLGTTPLVEVAIGAGPWLLRLHHDGYETVSYAIAIERGGHWDGVPPGGSEPEPVPLPPAGLLGEDLVYVPPSWTSIGDEEGVEPISRRRVWVDGFIMDRTPVTLAHFVDALQAELDAVGPNAIESLLKVHFLVGSLTLQVDDGRVQMPPKKGPKLGRAALLQLKRAQIEMVRRVRCARSGMPWRLPEAIEVEKALRGPAAWRFPWGDRFDPCLGQLAGSFRDPVPDPVGGLRGDRSVYGVCDLMSTAYELTRTPWFDEPPPDGGRLIARPEMTGVDTVQKGGSAVDPPPWSHGASRRRFYHEFNSPRCKVRFVCPWPPTEGR